MTPPNVWNRFSQSPMGQLWSRFTEGRIPVIGDHAHPLPSWVARPTASKWALVSGASDELDVMYGAYGDGALYVKDPDGVVHRIRYNGIGATTGKALVDMGFGVTHSTEDMWSSGGLMDADAMLGQIGLPPWMPSLQLSSFNKTFGAITSVSAAGLHGGPPVGPGETKKWLPHSAHDVWELAAVGAGLSLIVWGVPPIAVAWQAGLLRMLPGAGITTLVCYFRVDDDQSEDPFPISVGG